IRSIVLTYRLFCWPCRDSLEEGPAHDVRPGRRDPDTGEPLTLAFNVHHGPIEPDNWDARTHVEEAFFNVAQPRGVSVRVRATSSLFRLEGVARHDPTATSLPVRRRRPGCPPSVSPHARQGPSKARDLACPGHRAAGRPDAQRRHVRPRPVGTRPGRPRTSSPP